ncbi:hypothetical protein TRVL_03005 [Trypanosoma vivax]|nr:hypothetical protein TRVL_03005 [Trypanosoma vivax]
MSPLFVRVFLFFGNLVVGDVVLAKQLLTIPCVRFLSNCILVATSFFPHVFFRSVVLFPRSGLPGVLSARRGLSLGESCGLLRASHRRQWCKNCCQNGLGRGAVGACCVRYCLFMSSFCLRILTCSGCAAVRLSLWCISAHRLLSGVLCPLLVSCALHVFSLSVPVRAIFRLCAVPPCP